MPKHSFTSQWARFIDFINHNFGKHFRFSNNLYIYIYWFICSFHEQKYSFKSHGMWLKRAKERKREREKAKKKKIGKQNETIKSRPFLLLLYFASIAWRLSFFIKLYRIWFICNNLNKCCEKWQIVKSHIKKKGIAVHLKNYGHTICDESN